MRLKILKEDPTHVHLEHPSGQILKIEKNKLTPEAQAQIAHFYEGGGTDPNQPKDDQYGPDSDRYKGYTPASTTPRDPNPPAAPTPVESAIKNAFKFSSGGDVNPKLAKVPPKDRFPNTPHYDGGGQVPPPPSPVQTFQDSFRKATHYATGKEVKGDETPITASRLESQYAPEDEAAQRMSGGSPTIHNHYYMSPSPASTPAATTDDVTPSPAPTPAPVSAPADASGSPGVTPPPTPMAGGPVQAATSAPSLPSPNQDITAQAGQAMNQENAATTALGKVQSKESGQNAQALTQEGSQLADQAKRMEENGQHYTQMWSSIADNTDPKIDPNHYWSSKSTPQKISSAIGFMLSGLGMGLAGHAELAGKAVQDAINNDIDAQKATFNNKDNLLRQYTEMYHSKTMGEDALRLHYGAQVENMIKRNAAQAGTQTAGLVAQQAVAKNRQNYVGNLANLAQGQTAIDMAHYKQQAINNPSAQSATSASGNVNYDELNRKQLTGMMPQPDVEAATKEAGQLEESRALRNDFNRSFGDLNNKVLAGALSPADRKSAIWTLAGKLQHASAGRFNLEDAVKQMDAMFPGPLDRDSTRADKLKNSSALFDTLDAATPTLDRYGLKHPPHQASINEGKTAVNAQGQRIIMKNGQWTPYGG